MADTHIFVICFGSKCYYLIGGWRLQQIRNKEGLERLVGPLKQLRFSLLLVSLIS